MSADQRFNDNLAEHQLRALEALHSIMTETAAPISQDAARAKTTVQFLNIRLRAALALLRFKPRKIQAENTSQPTEAGRAPEPTFPPPPIESLIPFISTVFPPPSPLSVLSETRALLERAGVGMPQHVPRPAAA